MPEREILEELIRRWENDVGPGEPMMAQLAAAIKEAFNLGALAAYQHAANHVEGMQEQYYTITCADIARTIRGLAK